MERLNTDIIESYMIKSKHHNWGEIDSLDFKKMQEDGILDLEENYEEGMHPYEILTACPSLTGSFMAIEVTPDHVFPFAIAELSDYVLISTGYGPVNENTGEPVELLISNQDESDLSWHGLNASSSNFELMLAEMKESVSVFKKYDSKEIFEFIKSTSLSELGTQCSSVVPKLKKYLSPEQYEEIDKQSLVPFVKMIQQSISTDPLA